MAINNPLRVLPAQMPEVVEPVEMAAEAEEDFDLSELMGDVLDSAGGDGDDDDDDYGSDAGMSERGPARLSKKKKKKKKKDGGKKDKKDGGKKDKKEGGKKAKKEGGKKKKKSKKEL